MLHLRRNWEAKLKEAIAELPHLDKGLIKPMRVNL
jgi:putative proteasome-type protease